MTPKLNTTLWRNEMSEIDFSAEVLARLRPTFWVQTEVTGKLELPGMPPRRLRIDAIIRPKNPAGWKNPHVALGIEFKDPDQVYDTKEFTCAAAQAVHYAMTDFKGFGILPFVFVAPLAPGRKPDEMPKETRNLLARLRVGELIQHPENGISLVVTAGGETPGAYRPEDDRPVYNATGRLWSEKHGVEEGGTRNLKPVWGSKR